jgi:hypothetical protein
LKALIHYFIELCLLRRAPQDIPPSVTLLQVLCLAYLAVGVVVGAATAQGLWQALAQTLADLALLLGLLYAGLGWLGRLPRLVQAASALVGSGALLSLLVLVPLGMAADGEDSQMTGFAALLFLALLAWSIVVTGHILRHTLDLPLFQGALIAVAYNLLAYLLLGALFSGS